MYLSEDVKIKPEVTTVYEGDKFRSFKDDWDTIILVFLLLGLLGLFIYTFAFCPIALSQARIPGVDASEKLEAAGTVLRLLDTALFKWGARIFAGICVMSSAWSLKEQRFGIAIICIVGAIIFGTATHWVKNIFEISGSDSVFGQLTKPDDSLEVVAPDVMSGSVLYA